MRPVIGALLVEQQTIRFPIEPAIIERPVGEADESGINRPAAFEQRIPYRTGVEPRRGLHRARIAPCDFFVVQTLIEIIGDSHLESVEIEYRREIRRGWS